MTTNQMKAKWLLLQVAEQSFRAVESDKEPADDEDLVTALWNLLFILLTELRVYNGEKRTSAIDMAMDQIFESANDLRERLGIDEDY